MAGGGGGGTKKASQYNSKITHFESVEFSERAEILSFRKVNFALKLNR